MANLVTTNAQSALSDLKLWFKLQGGDNLKLSDISDLISLRWTWFKESWEFIKPGLEDLIENYQFPNQLQTQIEDMSTLIEVQRNNKNKNANPFLDSSVVNRYYAVFDNILINSIALSNVEERIIEQNTNRVNAFIKSDFVDIRSKLTAAREQISDITGGSDPTYNSTYSKGDVEAQTSLSINDIQNMQTYMSAISACTFIIANAFNLSTVTVDPFALAKVNSNNPDLEIQSGKSGNLVRMNYGDTLQNLAQRYLGNSDRWIEIAIANGLKSPFVDEVGVSVAPVSNGSGSQLNFSARDGNDEPNIEKFYIGQPIFLRSSVILNEEQRSILSIKEVPISGEIIIELDGNADLDKYKVSEGAFAKVYAKNTINSRFLVTIPSSEPLPSDFKTETPWFLKAKSEDERRAKVDLQLSDEGDLVFTPSGDLQLSFGLENAVQAMKIKLQTEQGTLAKHPEIGLPPVTGGKNNDIISIRNRVVDSITGMVSVDPRFDRVNKIVVDTITENGSSGIKFSVEVVLAGSDVTIPINFTVNTN